MSMMAFGFACLWGISPKKWFQNKEWLLGIAWVATYLFSWFWSEDTTYWIERVQVKLPILLLPLSFYFVPRLSKSQIWIITLTLCVLLCIGISYSSYHFLLQPQAYIEGYNYANILPTIPKNDHIRFSMLMAIGIAWCLSQYPHTKSKTRKWILISFIWVFAIWLHVLAARSGLVAFYILCSACLFRMLWMPQYRKSGIILLISFVVLAIIAFNTIPTLQHRIGHFKYSLIVFQQGEMAGNYNDIGRYISYDIAIRKIIENPWTGVGAGDIMSAMNDGYNQWYSHIEQNLRLVPHNQFLIAGMAAGIPGMLIFMAWIFFPLRHAPKNRDGFYIWVIWAMLFVTLLVEPMLEIQFGIFVYLFPLLWQQYIVPQRTPNKV